MYTREGVGSWILLCVWGEKRQKEPISSDGCISGVTAAVGLSVRAGVHETISTFLMQN